MNIFLVFYYYTLIFNIISNNILCSLYPHSLIIIFIIFFILRSYDYSLRNLDSVLVVEHHIISKLFTYILICTIHLLLIPIDIVFLKYQLFFIPVDICIILFLTNRLVNLWTICLVVSSHLCIYKLFAPILIHLKILVVLMNTLIS